ncbi:hypothetical protein NDN08_002820 [Rhodosorus marinus]|uniref:uroporphyrinogen-III C-methyltransferase n=1 Tax=Rhodosorus marinus TaxID=101924 RepID=A0AAV8UZ76_9RHOD|nr:hypothetical protein NDN08_002820 [Rhodosorus marinus]
MTANGKDMMADLKAAVESIRENRRENSSGPGSVYLVGTGPGDPSLLTLGAVQLMKSCDVVLYDRLVSNDIMNFVNPSARMIYVGKEKGFHTRKQEDIHDLLFQFAEAGGTILRLKGGDPYIFGRGGEELEYLEKKGVEVTCIPGITAASGIGAELGIPMTHRGVATSVRYITGHFREDGDEFEDSFQGAVDKNTTLVIYMGLSNLPKLSEVLLRHGLPTDTPAVAVERGTLPGQRIVFSEFGDFPQKVEENGLRSPTLLIIGQVVALSKKWQQFIAEAETESTPVTEDVTA